MKDSNEKMSAVPMRGMRDLLPEEVEKRQAVLEVIRTVYQSYGFFEVETPVVERSELLQTGEGGDNEKQTFSILRRGLETEEIKDAESIMSLVDGGLRFDLTVPLARYYANNRALLPDPFKSIQIGSVFRAERPQKGRYRQFTQCDIDIIGEESNLAEQELLLATTDALTKIGFTDFTVRVNDRRILKSLAEVCGFEEEDFDSVFITIDKLDKIGLDGVEKELNEKSLGEASSKLMTFLRKVDESEDSDNLFSKLPDGTDSEAISELKEIILVASNQDFKVIFDPLLVRGMGYYTGPIFEISDEGLSGSIAGGGRYDRMIEKYTGAEVPACGFSIGFERIMTLLEERGYEPEASKNKKVIIFDPANTESSSVLKIAKEIRSSGDIVLIQKRRKNTKNQLEELKNLGYSEFAIVENNLENIDFKSLD